MPHKLSFSLWFWDSKKSLKKNKDLLILGHPTYTYAGPPSTPHHQPNTWAAWVTVYNCQLCEKVFFPKSAAYLQSHIFATKHLTDKIKYSLETPFLSRFFIFYDFLNLNQDFRSNLQCKSCVQLPILWERRFSQTLRSHIFATKHSTDKIKYSLETPLLPCFFIFYYSLNIN